ncbi:MAG: transcriptional regulator [Proteobacteria bacterium ST_bin12]|nr:MAG: transcriptional regulator [Proteobacteria bacterium ST_bin12]
MALTRDTKETVAVRGSKEPEFARALLDEVLTLLLNGEPDTSKLILRDLINATVGFEGLSTEIHKPSKTIHRMLSVTGNPTVENFSSILTSIQKHMKVQVKALVISL